MFCKLKGGRKEKNVHCTQSQITWDLTENLRTLQLYLQTQIYLSGRFRAGSLLAEMTTEEGHLKSISSEI